MKNQELYIIHTDGGSRGNPGPAAYAYTIAHHGDLTIEQKTYMGSSTNNIAEYTAMVKALEHARDLKARHLLIYSDSELMVNQLNGVFKVKNAGLLPLYQQAKMLVKDFESVKIQHVFREQNQEADQLCNEALDNPRSSPPRVGSTLPPPRPLSLFDARPLAKPTHAPPATDLRSQAIAYLETCAAQWADADPNSPQVAEAWDRLWTMLREAGALRES